MRLTDTRVRNAKPQAKAYKLSDGGGMYLLVTPDGARYWRLDYRFAGKRLRHDNWVILGARCGRNSFSSGTTSVLRAVFASRDEPMASAPALPEATVSGQFVQIFGRKENPRGGDVLVKVRHR